MLPPVTVLLPVYNARAHVAEAVASILVQSHAEFELLAIDDGSTDGSGEYLDSVEDPRVRVIHQENAGLVETLNRGIGEARYEFVARMDADDVSAGERLWQQSAVLAARPELAAIGSCYEVITETGQHVGDVHVPADSTYLNRQLYFRNVLPHGGMMFRKTAVQDVGGYRAVGAEDYDLWARLAVAHGLGSVAQPLYRYRITGSGLSQTAGGHRQYEDGRRRVRADLHSQHPLWLPSSWGLARDGIRVTQGQPDCADLDFSFVFDHAGLAVALFRAGRHGAALRTALGVALFAARRPRALGGVKLFRHRAAGPPTRGNS